MGDMGVTTSAEHNNDPIDIDPDGDLVLRIRDQGTGTDYEYRVSTTALCRTSHYFHVLLDPSKFSEGVTVDRRLKALGGLETIPFSELPMILIPDIGQVSKGVSTKSAVALFLHVLHNDDFPWPIPRLSFVALLAIVADRFAAITPIANYVIQQNWKSKLVVQKGPSSTTEARVRQQLLIGLILGFPDWVRQYSAILIVQGSEKWKAQNEEDKEEEVLWWSLPNGIEGKSRLNGAAGLLHVSSVALQPCLCTPAI